MKSDLKLHAPSFHFDRIRSQPGVQVSNHLVIVLLMFWIYIFCTIFGEQVAATVIMLIAQFAGFDWGKYRDAELVMELFLTTVCIGLTIVCCCGIESRPLRTMYLTRRKMLPDYLTGVLLGFGLMTVVVLAAWGSGAVRLEGIHRLRHPVWMLLLIIGWIIQGFSEELTFRGFLMTSVGTHHSVWLAVAVSAVNFAALHFANAGFSVFAAVNLILFGVVTSLYVLRTGSIWGAAAMHSVWNWAQGNFYGMQVSGIRTDSTVFRFMQTGKAVWIGGGVFGLEAGAATTAVLLLTAVILLFMPQRKENDTEDMTNGTV